MSPNYFEIAARQAREAAQQVRVRTVQQVRTSQPTPAMRVTYTDQASGRRVTTLVVDEDQVYAVLARACGKGDR
jgi:predicted peptidase